MRGIALVAAAVALGLLGGELQAHGYLGGRDESGPLELEWGGVGLKVKPGETHYILAFTRARQGGAVRVESFRPLLASPGLEILPAYALVTHDAAGLVAQWPPRRAGRALVGAELRHGDESFAIGLRARAHGFFYLDRPRTLYRRGGRRFEAVDTSTVCLDTTGSTNGGCYPNAVLTRGFRGLAEVGGPSDYGPGARLEEADSSEPTKAVLPGTRVPHVFEITVTNLGREPAKLEAVGMERVGTEDMWVDLRPASRLPIAIPAGGSKPLRVEVLREGCDRPVPNARLIVSSLDARVDGHDESIELSVPLAFPQPGTCTS